MTVVVGGGIAGACVALALRERGAEVRLLERGRTGGSATRASAGMLAPLYEADPASPLFRLGVASRERWGSFVERLEEWSGRVLDWRSDGMLVAAFDEAEQQEAEASAARCRDAGLRAELLSPEEAGRLQPGLSPEALAWLWLPEEGQVDTRAVALALAAALPKAGVEVHEGCDAAEVEVQGERASGVRLRGGERVGAERVVVACGAWSGELAGLPRPLPVRPVRGQMLRLRLPSPEPRRLVADSGGRYVVPSAAGTAYAGSTMEETGFDDGTTEEGMQLIREGAGRLLPALAGAQILEAWAGLRPVSADGLPVLGPDPEAAGLLYATGYGRNGILIAPLAAEVVAELALEGAPEVEWRPFRPERFV